MLAIEEFHSCFGSFCLVYLFGERLLGSRGGLRCRLPVEILRMPRVALHVAALMKALPRYLDD